MANERLYSREDDIHRWVLAQIEDAAVFAAERGLATKDQVRQAFEEALQIADEPEPGDPGLWWGFGFLSEDERDEPH
jgi:hypothetical protein